MVGMSVILFVQCKYENISVPIEMIFFHMYKLEVSENLSPYRRYRKRLAYHQAWLERM